MTKKAQINMSLIPLFLILAVILGAGYFLIQGDIKFPKFDNGPKLRRLEGFPTIVYTSETMERQRKIIKTREELNEFLNIIDKTGLVTLKETVDFNKEILIGVSSETVDPVGHKLKIKKAIEDKENKKIIINVEETFPLKECLTENDLHIAVDLIAITKTDSQIVFERSKREACE
jgi:hypothetical protein